MNPQQDQILQRLLVESGKEFDLVWGIAPPDSLKGKKGADIRTLLTTALTKAFYAGADAQRERGMRRL